MEEDKDVLYVPVEIGKKLSRTSLDNATWHTHVDQQYTTAISRNISETQYFCQNYSYNILEYINIYQYMSDIYMIQKIMQSIICHTILHKCFSECTMNIYQYKFYIIRFIILNNRDCHSNNKWDDMQQCNNSRSNIR